MVINLDKLGLDDLILLKQQVEIRIKEEKKKLPKITPKIEYEYGKFEVKRVRECRRHLVTKKNEYYTTRPPKYVSTRDSGETVLVQAKGYIKWNTTNLPNEGDIVLCRKRITKDGWVQEWKIIDIVKRKEE